MRILVSLVGMRDPEGDNGTEGSVVTAARHLTPERVHLLATPDVEPHADQTKDRLNQIEPSARVTVHQLTLEDPSDLSEGIKAVDRALDSALFRVTPEDEVQCALSSGTPQLRMALTLLLHERPGNVRFWDVRDPRFVTAERVRVREVDLGLLRQSRVTATVRHAWARFDFEAVAAALRDEHDRAPLGPRASVLEWCAQLADAYARWDAVDWPEALTKLTALAAKVDGRSPCVALRPHLVDQIAILTAIAAATSEGYLMMLDLAHNATRRLGAGQYVDALSRWRRTLEGALTAVARAMPGVEIDDKGKMNLDGDALEAWQRFRRGRSSREGDDSLPQQAGIPDLLALVKHAGLLPAKLEQTVQGMTEARNRSIAAHGVQPVKENDVRSALQKLDGVLVALFPQESGAQPPDSYPFGEPELAKIGQILDRIVGQPG